jgi:hypothetical protein
MPEETKKIDWKKVWSFIKGKIFLALIIIALTLFSAMQCSRIRELKRQQDISDQNIIALNDTLKFERKKNGELLVSISGYIATEKELKTLNKDLWNRVQAQDGKIISLNHVIIRLVQDTATLRKYLVEKDKVIEKLLKIDDNTYAAPWSMTYKYDSTNYDIFTGKTWIGVLNKDPLELAHINTELTKRLTQIDLTWGQKVEKDKLRVFVQSNYPGFTVSQMEGVLIDPNTNPLIKKLMKEKKWFTGFSIGVGVTGGFNITTGGYGLVVGPTVIYNIYSF